MYEIFCGLSTTIFFDANRYAGGFGGEIANYQIANSKLPNSK